MATLKNDGKTTLATRAIADTPAAFTYMAVSANTAAESATGTTLAGEITNLGLARAAATCTNPSAYVTQWVKTWTVSGNATVAKIGIFNAASGGNMLVEHLLPTARTLVKDDTFTGTAQMTTSS